MSTFIFAPSFPPPGIIVTNLAQGTFSLYGSTSALLLANSQNTIITQIVLYNPTDNTAIGNTFSVGTNSPDYDNVVPTFKVNSWAATATFSLPIDPNGILITDDLYVNFGTDIGDDSGLSYVVNGYYV